MMLKLLVELLREVVELLWKVAGFEFSEDESFWL
jgi:hypothetical protein